MSLKLSGVALGNITGGPSSITLADLADVSIVSPLTGQYLRYNETISEWQNVYLDTDVYNYLDGKMSGSDGVEITYTSGPQTIVFGLGDITPTSISTSGTITASNLSGSSTGTNTGDQTITLTNDVTGSGTGSFAATLATVNSSPQTDTFRKITVNGKGLVTETSAVASSDITTALGYTPVNKAGDTMTGLLVLSADPSAALGAATKQYVDNVAEGLKTKPAAEVATTATLTSTYSNGASGVGATLTATTNGAFPTIDGVTLTSTTPGSNGVLVKNQSAPAQNGRYNLTQLGDGSNPWILTRCGLCDTAAEIPGAYVFVKDGGQAGTGWVAVVADPSTFVVGTDAITWSQFSGAGTYVAGSGIDISSNIITNIGVTSAVAGTNIAVSAATGAVTFSVTGTVPTATTSTNIAGGTAGSISYQSGASTTLFLSPGTSGQVLTSQGTSAPIWSSPSSVPALTSTRIAFGSGSNLLTESAKFTWTDASNRLELGDSTGSNTTIRAFAETSASSIKSITVLGATNNGNGSGGNVLLTGGAAAGSTATSIGGSVTLTGGTANSSSGGGVITVNGRDPVGTTPGSISIISGNNANYSGDITIGVGHPSGTATALGLLTLRGSQAIATGDNTNGGHVIVRGGNSGNPVASADLNGGNLTLSGGTGHNAGTGGNVSITAGTIVDNTSGTGGNILFSTGTGSLTERLRIIPAGAWGLSGANYGTSGQVIISAGSGSPPAWGDVSATASTVSDDTTTNATMYPVWVTANTGSLPMKVTSTKLSYNPSTGTLTSTVFNATSTARVKSAITDIGKSYLDKFMLMKPREYDRRDYVAHEFGFVAEEMNNVYPEIVGKDEEGRPTGIDYGRISAILTAKVQEQQSVIDDLKTQISVIMELLKGTK